MFTAGDLELVEICLERTSSSKGELSNLSDIEVSIQSVTIYPCDWPLQLDVVTMEESRFREVHSVLSFSVEKILCTADIMIQ